MIYHGDCLSVLRAMPENTFQVCVTSPPYWSLRDYGVQPTIWGGSERCSHTWVTAGSKEGYGAKKKWQHSMTNAVATNGRGEPQASKRARSREDGGWTQIEQGQFCVFCHAWLGCLGLEPTLEMYVGHLVEVFTEVRRVLRPDGTLWLNIGDSYSQSGGNGKQGKTSQRVGRANVDSQQKSGTQTPPPGLKPKDLCMIPARVALALQASGWYLRSDIIWSKTNPMPESTQDRPTKSHEYVFLLAKSESYYYDAHAIRESLSPTTHPSGNKARKYRQDHGGPQGKHRRQAHAVPWQPTAGGRNRRSVWTISTAPFPGAHFATFPPRLVEPCILAGSSERGCCSVCGAPFRRVVKLGAPLSDQKAIAGADRRGEYHGKATKAYAGAGAQDPSATKARILEGMRERITVGWKPTCSHTLREIEPCMVLDPFAGAGTTGIVAQRLGRQFTGIELGAQYVEMATKRIAEASA